MKNWKEALEMESIAAEFTDVGEELEADLSGVYIQAVMDSHDGGYELDVFIYGKEDEGMNLPVVHVRLPASCGLMDEENRLLDGSVTPEAVTALFDGPFLVLMEEKGLCIRWNASMSEGESITLPEIRSSGPLLPLYA